MNEAPCGSCPICAAPSRERERRPNGNNRCKIGHTHPVRDAKKSGGHRRGEGA